MDRLLGRDNHSHNDNDDVWDDARLLQIIRRNAFGGDFVTDQVVERRWRQSITKKNNNPRRRRRC